MVTEPHISGDAEELNECGFKNIRSVNIYPRSVNLSKALWVLGMQQ